MVLSIYYTIFSLSVHTIFDKIKNRKEIIMKIGNIQINHFAALSPMAGVTDSAFRRICMRYGAGYTTSEMISAKALTLGDQKTKDLIARSSEETPYAIQLFGSDPDVMGQATKLLLPYKPDIIDINMGCPAPKITSNGAGSKLMQDPDLAGRICRAVVENSSGVPVTVKIRKGWDKEHINAVQVALKCQQAGVAAITVHGRTRDQMYAPPVDWQIIAQVKQAVDIPVIGNGDVYTPQDAQRMLQQTGCDYLFIGRGALGHPWLFAQINEYLQTGQITTLPTNKEKFEVLYQQAQLAVQSKGEYRAMCEMRKHAAWYFKGSKGASRIRGMCSTLSTLQDLKQLIEQASDFLAE